MPALPVDRRSRVWDRLRSTSARYRIVKLSILESNVFAPQELELPRAMVVVGRHASGKTTFLRLLEIAFGLETHDNLWPSVHSRADGYRAHSRLTKQTVDPEVLQRFLAEDKASLYTRLTGKVELTVAGPGGSATRLVDLDWRQDQRRSVWANLGVDMAPEPLHLSSLRAFNRLTFLFQDYPWDRRWAQEVLHRYSASELEALRDILGRRYDELGSYKFRYDRDDDIEPLMLGTVDGLSIETASMSRGEIWIHYVLAYTVRLGAAGPLMLDEPESLLAPRGHQPFIDEIARTVLAEAQQLLVATHSLEVMSRFPLEATRLCVSTADGVELIKPASVVEVRDALGYEHSLLLLILVEDTFAQTVLEILISHFSPALTRVIEIKPSGGAESAALTARILSGLRRIHCVAVLDGDERSRRKSLLSLLFLPGTRRPEDELLAAAARHVDAFAAQLNRARRDVLVAIDSLRDSSHQRIPRNLAEAIGQTEPIVVHALINCWLMDEEIKQQSIELVDSLNNLGPSAGG